MRGGSPTAPRLPLSAEQVEGAGRPWGAPPLLEVGEVISRRGPLPGARCLVPGAWCLVLVTHGALRHQLSLHPHPPPRVQPAGQGLCVANSSAVKSDEDVSGRECWPHSRSHGSRTEVIQGSLQFQGPNHSLDLSGVPRCHSSTALFLLSACLLGFCCCGQMLNQRLSCLSHLELTSDIVSVHSCYQHYLCWVNFVHSLCHLGPTWGSNGRLASRSVTCADTQCCALEDSRIGLMFCVGLVTSQRARVGLSSVLVSWG